MMFVHSKNKKLLIGIFSVLLIAGIVLGIRFSINQKKPVVLLDPIPEEELSISARGFVSSDTVPASGVVAILDTTKGPVIRFEDLTLETDDMSVKVFASTDLSFDSMIFLADLKNRRGTFNLPLEENIDPAVYPYIVLWSQELNVLYAYVEFSK